MRDQDVLATEGFARSSSGEACFTDEEIRIRAERRALARDLHDTVVQPLTSLLMSFRYLEYLPQRDIEMGANLDLWKELAQEALDSLRNSLADLHTPMRSQPNLPDALERLLAPQLCSRGMRLLVERQNWPTDLPVDWTSNLYLLVREALTNAEKHGRATIVTVLLQADDEQVSISIVDNGVGFHPDDLISTSRQDRYGAGLGIKGMQERVRMLGGELQLMTAPGCGVRLEIHTPIPNNASVRSASSADVSGLLDSSMRVDQDTYFQ